MGTVAAAALAVVFVSAAAGKLADPRSFARYAEPLLGARSRAAGFGLIGIEVLLALLPASAALWSGLRVAAGCASALFIVCATGAHAAVEARGGASRCQCFGALTKHRASAARSWWDPPTIALRNGTLVAGGLEVFAANDIVVALLSLVPAALLAAGLGAMLVRDRATLGTPLHPRLREQAAHMPLLQAQTWWVDGRPRRF